MSLVERVMDFWMIPLLGLVLFCYGLLTYSLPRIYRDLRFGYNRFEAGMMLFVWLFLTSVFSALIYEIMI